MQFLYKTDFIFSKRKNGGSTKGDYVKIIIVANVSQTVHVHQFRMMDTKDTEKYALQIPVYVSQH